MFPKSASAQPGTYMSFMPFHLVSVLLIVQTCEHTSVRCQCVRARNMCGKATMLCTNLSTYLTCQPAAESSVCCACRSTASRPVKATGLSCGLHIEPPPSSSQLQTQGPQKRCPTSCCNIACACLALCNLLAVQMACQVHLRGVADNKMNSWDSSSASCARVK